MDPWDNTCASRNESKFSPKREQGVEGSGFACLSKATRGPEQAESGERDSFR